MRWLERPDTRVLGADVLRTARVELGYADSFGVVWYTALSRWLHVVSGKGDSNLKLLCYSKEVHERNSPLLERLLNIALQVHFLESFRTEFHLVDWLRACLTVCLMEPRLSEYTGTDEGFEKALSLARMIATAYGDMPVWTSASPEFKLPEHTSVEEFRSKHAIKQMQSRSQLRSPDNTPCSRCRACAFISYIGNYCLNELHYMFLQHKGKAATAQESEDVCLNALSTVQKHLEETGKHCKDEGQSTSSRQAMRDPKPQMVWCSTTCTQEELDKLTFPDIHSMVTNYTTRASTPLPLVCAVTKKDSSLPALYSKSYSLRPPCQGAPSDSGAIPRSPAFQCFAANSAAQGQNDQAAEIRTRNLDLKSKAGPQEGQHPQEKSPSKEHIPKARSISARHLSEITTAQCQADHAAETKGERLGLEHKTVRSDSLGLEDRIGTHEAPHPVRKQQTAHAQHDPQPNTAAAQFDGAGPFIQFEYNTKPEESVHVDTTATAAPSAHSGPIKDEPEQLHHAGTVNKDTAPAASIVPPEEGTVQHPTRAKNYNLRKEKNLKTRTTVESRSNTYEPNAIHSCNPQTSAKLRTDDAAETRKESVGIEPQAGTHEVQDLQGESLCGRQEAHTHQDQHVNATAHQACPAIRNDEELDTESGNKGNVEKPVHNDTRATAASLAPSQPIQTDLDQLLQAISADKEAIRAADTDPPPTVPAQDAPWGNTDICLLEKEYRAAKSLQIRCEVSESKSKGSGNPQGSQEHCPLPTANPKDEGMSSPGVGQGKGKMAGKTKATRSYAPSPPKKRARAVRQQPIRYDPSVPTCAVFFDHTPKERMKALRQTRKLISGVRAQGKPIFPETLKELPQQPVPLSVDHLRTEEDCSESLPSSSSMQLCHNLAAETEAHHPVDKSLIEVIETSRDSAEQFEQGHTQPQVDMPSPHLVDIVPLATISQMQHDSRRVPEETASHNTPDWIASVSAETSGEQLVKAMEEDAVSPAEVQQPSPDNQAEEQQAMEPMLTTQPMQSSHPLDTAAMDAATTLQPATAPTATAEPRISSERVQESWPCNQALQQQATEATATPKTVLGSDPRGTAAIHAETSPQKARGRIASVQPIIDFKPVQQSIPGSKASKQQHVDPITTAQPFLGSDPMIVAASVAATTPQLARDPIAPSQPTIGGEPVQQSVPGCKAVKKHPADPTPTPQPTISLEPMKAAVISAATTRRLAPDAIDSTAKPIINCEAVQQTSSSGRAVEHKATKPTAVAQTILNSEPMKTAPVDAATTPQLDKDPIATTQATNDGEPAQHSLPGSKALEQHPAHPSPTPQLILSSKPMNTAVMASTMTLHSSADLIATTILRHNLARRSRVMCEPVLHSSSRINALKQEPAASFPSPQHILRSKPIDTAVKAATTTLHSAAHPIQTPQPIGSCKPVQQAAVDLLREPHPVPSYQLVNQSAGDAIAGISFEARQQYPVNHTTMPQPSAGCKPTQQAAEAPFPAPTAPKHGIQSSVVTAMDHGTQLQPNTSSPPPQQLAANLIPIPEAANCAQLGGTGALDLNFLQSWQKNFQAQKEAVNLIQSSEPDHGTSEGVVAAAVQSDSSSIPAQQAGLVPIQPPDPRHCMPYFFQRAVDNTNVSTATRQLNPSSLATQQAAVNPVTTAEPMHGSIPRAVAALDPTTVLQRSSSSFPTQQASGNACAIPDPKHGTGLHVQAIVDHITVLQSNSGPLPAQKAAADVIPTDPRRRYRTGVVAAADHTILPQPHPLSLSTEHVALNQILSPGPTYGTQSKVAEAVDPTAVLHPDSCPLPVHQVAKSTVLAAVDHNAALQPDSCPLLAIQISMDPSPTPGPMQSTRSRVLAAVDQTTLSHPNATSVLTQQAPEDPVLVSEPRQGSGLGVLVAVDQTILPQPFTRPQPNPSSLPTQPEAANTLRRQLQTKLDPNGKLVAPSMPVLEYLCEMTLRVVPEPTDSTPPADPAKIDRTTIQQGINNSPAKLQQPELRTIKEITKRIVPNLGTPVAQLLNAGSNRSASTQQASATNQKATVPRWQALTSSQQDPAQQAFSQPATAAQQAPFQQAAPQQAAPAPAQAAPDYQQCDLQGTLATIQKIIPTKADIEQAVLTALQGDPRPPQVTPAQLQVSVQQIIANVQRASTKHHAEQVFAAFRKQTDTQQVAAHVMGALVHLHYAQKTPTIPQVPTHQATIQQLQAHQAPHGQLLISQAPTQQIFTHTATAQQASSQQAFTQQMATAQQASAQDAKLQKMTAETLLTLAGNKSAPPLQLTAPQPEQQVPPTPTPQAADPLSLLHPQQHNSVPSPVSKVPQHVTPQSHQQLQKSAFTICQPRNDAYNAVTTPPSRLSAVPATPTATRTPVQNASVQDTPQPNLAPTARTPQNMQSSLQNVVKSPAAAASAQIVNRSQVRKNLDTNGVLFRNGVPEAAHLALQQVSTQAGPSLYTGSQQAIAAGNTHVQAPLGQQPATSDPDSEATRSDAEPSQQDDDPVQSSVRPLAGAAAESGQKRKASSDLACAPPPQVVKDKSKAGRAKKEHHVAEMVDTLKR